MQRKCVGSQESSFTLEISLYKHLNSKNRKGICKEPSKTVENPAFHLSSLSLGDMSDGR